MHLRPSRQRLIASKSLFTFSSIVSIGTLLLYNVPFFGFVASHTDEDGFGNIFLLASLVVVMLVLNFMMTYLVMWLLRFVGRILLALLAIINATALHFILTYGVIIDATNATKDSNTPCSIPLITADRKASDLFTPDISLLRMQPSSKSP